MANIWKPSVTVAAIIYDGQRFLMIEEQTPDGLRINQPAGHLEPDESLQQAVTRETLEETAYDFTPTELVGTYLSRYVAPTDAQSSAKFSAPPETITYLRFAFAGSLGKQHDRALDEGIVRTRWMTLEELQATHAQHRNPLVLQCIQDYLRGQRAPLSMLYTHVSVLGESE